jgi:hypothetical protein
LHRSIVVPVDWVEQADEHAVMLNARLSDLDDLPEYHEVEFVEPPGSARMAGYDPDNVRVWALAYGTIPEPRVPIYSRLVRLGVEDDAVPIGRGTRVHTADGETLGTINHLLVDPTTLEVTHFVVHPGFRIGRDDDMLVSLDEVASLGKEAVYLRVNRDEVKPAERYRPAVSDAKLRSRIARSLETQPETRDRGVRVETENGIVRLLGDVPEPVAEAAKRLARRVRGVVGIEDRTKRPT